MSDNLGEMFRAASEAKFELLLSQFNQLSEWMKEDFPEVEYNVEFNSDLVNNRLNVIQRIFTGKEMSPNDRLLRKTKMSISQQEWEGPNMEAKLSKIYETVRPQIAKLINDWYAQRKEKDEHGIR